MINDGSTPETVGMTTLEPEYLASQILSGIILPDKYTALRVNMAGLKIIDASPKLTKLLETLQDLVVDKFGLLKDQEMKSYYMGENPELKSLVKKIFKETEIQIELYGQAVEDKLEQVIGNIESHAKSMDYYDLIQGVNKSQFDSEDAKNYDNIQTDLRRSKGILTSIFKAYGVGESRIPTKPVVEVGLTPRYKLFINELMTNIDSVTTNIMFTITLSKALDSIISLIPKDELDPYLSDVCKNFLSVVTDPKSFYTKCKQDEIVSEAVGTMFAHSYPGFYNLYQDMCLEDYDGLEYQSQLDFQKCFGIGQDNSALTTLCSGYVKLGFKQQ